MFATNDIMIGNAPLNVTTSESLISFKRNGELKNIYGSGKLSLEQIEAKCHEAFIDLFDEEELEQHCPVLETIAMTEATVMYAFLHKSAKP